MKDLKLPKYSDISRNLTFNTKYNILWKCKHFFLTSSPPPRFLLMSWWTLLLRIVNCLPSDSLGLRNKHNLSYCPIVGQLFMQMLDSALCNRPMVGQCCVQLSKCWTMLCQTFYWLDSALSNSPMQNGAKRMVDKYVKFLTYYLKVLWDKLRLLKTMMLLGSLGFHRMRLKSWNLQLETKKKYVVFFKCSLLLNFFFYIYIYNNFDNAMPLTSFPHR